MSAQAATDHADRRAQASALARAFLDREHGRTGFQSVVSTTPDCGTPADPSSLFGPRNDFPRELFTPMIVLDLAYRHDPSSPIRRQILDQLITHRTPDGNFTFFAEPDLLPADSDSTAVGLRLLVEMAGVDDPGVSATVDRLIANVDAEGVIEVYLPPRGERRYVDHTVCVNVLHLVADTGRLHRVGPTLDHIQAVLSDDRFVDGSRYYPSPDAFLQFLARATAAHPELLDRFAAPLRRALGRRLGTSDVPMELAMRLVAARALAVDDLGELQLLLDQQRSDGSWAPTALYRFGRRQGFFGGSALTTAFALAALADPES